MAGIYVAKALGALIPTLQRDRSLLRAYGLVYDDVHSCERLPARIGRRDLVLWDARDERLPELPPGATGLIRSTKTGSFGLCLGSDADSARLLVSRWDEIQVRGGQSRFSGSVADTEGGLDALRWTVERLALAHSHSFRRPINWERLQRGAARRLDAASTPAERLRAWEWLLARLHDGHTKVVALEGSTPCRRVHCGVYGEFLDPGRYLVRRVYPGGAGAAAGLVAGMVVSRVNGRDWRSYLRAEGEHWSFSSHHLRRACRHLVPWHQPGGTRLTLDTDRGRRTIEFGEEPYPGFFHWMYEGPTEAIAFSWVGPDAYRLRIAYFPADAQFLRFAEEAVRSVPSGARLELDLRGNAGGNRDMMAEVAGLFLPAGTPLSRRRGRRVGGGFSRWTILRTTGRQAFGGSLTVLMDEGCASTTESLLGALRAANRAALAGRRSAGSTGNPRTYLFPDEVRFTCSSWEETAPDGRPIEGQGIATNRALQACGRRSGGRVRPRVVETVPRRPMDGGSRSLSRPSDTC